MKKKIIINIILILILLAPTFPVLALDYKKDNTFNVTVEEASRNIGGAIGNGCYGKATGCRKYSGYGIRVTVSKYINGVKKSSKQIYDSNTKTKAANLPTGFTNNVGTYDGTDPTWYYESYFSNIINRIANLNGSSHTQICGSSELQTWVEIVSNVNAKAQEEYANYCNSEEPTSENLKKLSEAINNYYIEVEPTMTVTYGREEAWYNNVPYTNDQIKEIVASGELPTDDQTLSDPFRITAIWQFTGMDSVSKQIRERLGISNHGDAVKYLMTADTITGNELIALEFQIKDNTTPSYACNSLDCKTARKAVGFGNSIDDMLKADMYYYDIIYNVGGIKAKILNMYKDYNTMYKQFKKLQDNELGEQFLRNRTAREIAKIFNDNKCKHEYGYYNNNNCSAVEASTASNYAAVSWYISMDKSVSGYPYIPVSSKATSWDWGNSGYGIAVYHVDTSSWGDSLPKCSYKNGKLYNEQKPVDKPTGNSKVACCELNDQEGNSLWLDPNDFEKFKKSSVYKEYCPANKCVWNGTSTKKMQIQGAKTLDCCDVNNYDDDPTNQTGWNKWYNENCVTIVYACTIKDLKNISSTTDSKINCCYSTNDYSPTDKAEIQAHGGLEGYLQYKTTSGTTASKTAFKKVLNICYPSEYCQVSINTMCPSCSNNNSTGSISDYVDYKNVSSSIPKLSYTDEAIKKCVINNNSLLEFSNAYCSAYCGVEVEYDYPSYENTSVLAGTKITVGINGSFSPIELSGTKKCFIESINYSRFIKEMDNINKQIADKAAEVKKYDNQIKSVRSDSGINNCDYIYKECGIGSCSSSRTKWISYWVTSYVANEDGTLSASGGYWKNDSVCECVAYDYTRYEQKAFTNYIGGGETSTFCVNSSPVSGWLSALNRLQDEYKQLVATRQSYINAMNNCSNIKNMINFNEFNPSISIGYSSGKYNVSDIELSKNMTTSSSGTIGVMSSSGVTCKNYDSTGSETNTFTAYYSILNPNDASNHEFTISKKMQFYLNGSNNYTYVDLSTGDSTNTKTSESSIYIGPHLPIQYNSKEAQINKISIKTNTFGINKFDTKLNSERDCKNYECPFHVYNELITDKGLNVVYRPISLTNPFPEENGNGRKTGSNWCNDSDCSNTNATVNRVIKNNRGVSDNAVYTMTPLYTIKLTPKDILNIRSYNLGNQYGDFKLKCDQKSDGSYKCYSDFLREKIRTLFTNESCAFGTGSKCQSNGKDVY